VTIRCANCHATVWIQSAERGARSVAVTCGGCGQQYHIRAGSILDRNDRSMATRARQLAKDEHLDLPSAYSVLLGVATAEELRELSGAPATPDRTASSGGPTAGGYDRAFQSAIDDGLLSARQATERGQRNTLVALLASRHRLSQAVAGDVADNRISLLEALRSRKPTAGTVRAGARRGVAAPLAVLLLLIGAIGIAAATRESRVRPMAGRGTTGPFGATEVRTTSDGGIVQVLGPDPKSVLRAYCAASEHPLEPLEIVPLAHDGERSRLGLLRDPRHPAELQAITIREDRASGRWRAGEGSRALRPRPAPDGAERALRRR